MKEIVVFMGFLVVIYTAIWMFIFVKQKFVLGRRKITVGGDIRRGERDEKILPIIIAGVSAYEDSLKNKKRLIKKKVYKVVKQNISWWRMAGRTG